MIKLPIGSGDFERNFSVLVDGKFGYLKIRRDIHRDYGQKKNETGRFMYTMFLDSVKLRTDSSVTELTPKTLLRIAPDAKYSLEPACQEQPSKMRKGDIPFNPVKTITFIPPMLEEPTKAGFSPVRIFAPYDRTRDWYCGYYNDGEELGISPIEIAHGYVGNDYLSDPKRNTPHYHKKILEGWIPLYGKAMAYFCPASDAQISFNDFKPNYVGKEKLEDIVFNYIFKKEVELSSENLVATVPGEAHIMSSVKGSALWETITFKYPGLSKEESEKDKVEYKIE